MDNIVNISKNYVGLDKQFKRCFKSYDNGLFARSYHCDDDNFIEPRRVDASKIILATDCEIILDKKLSDALFYTGTAPDHHNYVDAKEFLFETLLVSDLPHTFEETNKEVWERFWSEFYEIRLRSYDYLYMN